MTTRQTTPKPEPEPLAEEAPPIVISDEYKGALDDLDRAKVPWRPNPGDKVVGRVTAMMTATSEYGEYPLLTLDPGPDSPLVDVHCFHAWLKGDVSRLDVREGDIFGVKFIDTGGPRNAARYRTSLKRTGTGDPYRMGQNMTAVAGAPVQQSLPVDEEPF